MSQNETDEWRELADTIHERGGVPETRAKAIALVATGRTYEEAAEKLELEGDSRRSQIGMHVRRYRNEDRAEAEWLAEHGPDV